MMSNYNNSQNAYLPTVLTLLQSSSPIAFIRLLFNRPLSSLYLTEYGKQPQPSFSEYELHRIGKYVEQFSFSQVHFIGHRQVLNIVGRSRGKGISTGESEFLREVVRKKLKKGQIISREIRGNLYMQFTDYFQDSSLYNALKLSQIPTDTKEAISKDVRRTHLNPPQTNQNQIGLNPYQSVELLRFHLIEVLEQFAKYNPFVGYCQGMNNVVSFMLQASLSPEQAFYLLRRITQCYLPCDYYSSMESVVACVRAVWEMLPVTHKSMAKSMKAVIRNMGMSGYDTGGQGQTSTEDGFMVVMGVVFQWFVCLFTSGGVDESITLMIMDWLVVDGIVVLFKSALAFFDHLEQHIEGITSFEQYISTVEEQIHKFNNTQLLLKRLAETYINPDLLHLFINKCSASNTGKQVTTTTTSKTPPKNKIGGKSVDKTISISHCNPNWSACLPQLQQNFANGVRTQVFVFRVEGDVRIQKEYLTKINKKYFKMDPIKTGLRMGRMIHICKESRDSTRSGTSVSASSNSNKHPTISDPSDYSPRLSDMDMDMDSANRLKISHNSFKINPNSFKINPNSNQPKKYKVTPPTQQQVRSKMMQKFIKIQQSRQSLFERSQSMQFMQMMVQNESFSNLLQIMGRQQMQAMFSEHIDQKQ